MRDSGDSTLTGEAVLAAAREPLAPVDVAERYRVGAPLGRGATGVVYRARDTTLDRDVAIKVLHHDDRDRLLAEAQILARLAHPNVVVVHDVGRVGEDVFLCMELVHGRDLKRVLGEHPPWRRALELVCQAGDGLAAAHRAGVIHRDFKPSNVLVGDDGRVRVGDFGLAVARGTPDNSVGTRAYLPPERKAGVAADARGDQFAFCVTLFEALYGVRPFPDEPEARAAAIEAGAVQSPSTEVGVPAPLHRAIVRGLAPVPADRFATMDDLLAALRAPRRGAPRWLVIGGAALVLGFVLVLGAFALTRGEPPGPAARATVAVAVDAAVSHDADEVAAATLAQLAEVERLHGASSLEAARAHADAATVMRLSGRGPRARDLLERAQPKLAAAPAPALELASARYWLAFLYLNEQRAAEAVTLAEAALGAVVAHRATAKEIVETRTMLARALYENRERDRALAVAAETYREARALGDDELMRRIDSYLVAHGEASLATALDAGGR